MTNDLTAAPMSVAAPAALPSRAQTPPPVFTQYRCVRGSVADRPGGSGTGAVIDNKLRPSSLTDRPPG